MSLQQVYRVSKQHGYGVVSLEYNNVFLVDLNHYDGSTLSARDAYDSGYRLRTDRAAKFPLNKRVDYWLHTPPAKLLEEINAHFAMYHGKYTLEIEETE
jgi:hypothetical protein